MSGIYFATAGESVWLQGSERGHLTSLYCSMASGMAPKPDQVEHLWVAGEYGLLEGLNENWTWWGPTISSDNGRFRIGGRTWSPWHIALNTGVSLESDALSLACWIDATCEIHGWIGEDDRGEVAGIIRTGRRRGIFRDMYDGEGNWEDVLALLEGPSEGPVVMSYSVCDIFDFDSDDIPPDLKLDLENTSYFAPDGYSGENECPTVFDLNRLVFRKSADEQGYRISPPVEEGPCVTK